MSPRPCSIAASPRIDLPESEINSPPRGIALLLASLAALGPFSIDTYLPSFQDIGESLHATPIEVQQTLSAYLLPFAVMALWHGAISDASGRPGAIGCFKTFCIWKYRYGCAALCIGSFADAK